MAKGEFDPSSWRTKKYEGGKLDFLAPEICVAELSHIQTIINGLILGTQVEFQENLQTDYDVVGVIIYGSFARGDVHRLSDVDLLLLATQELHDLESNFAFRLSQAGIKREVDLLGSLIGGDRNNFKPVLRKDMRRMIGQHWLVVSPYPAVEAGTISALQKF